MFKVIKRRSDVCVVLSITLSWIYICIYVFAKKNMVHTSDVSPTEYLHSDSSNVFITTESKQWSSSDPVLVDAKAFLEATPQTDAILATHPVQFLKGVKNPCFALTNKTVNVGNINISVAIAKGYQIRCLPYFYLAGFTKCATGDIFMKLAHHQLITGGQHPRGKFQQGKRKSKWEAMRMTKEEHFWDNMYFNINYTFDLYSSFHSANRIVEDFKRYSNNISVNESAEDDFRNLIYADGTPRTIWNGDTWHEDHLNSELKEPVILLPHKLHHVQPNAKFIVTLRNPTDRLFSDFKFYFQRSLQTTEVFHEKVVAAIKWWKDCTKTMGPNSRACVYGKAPKGLPELGFEICIKNKTYTAKHYGQGHSCQSKYGWTKNVADRLRVSMYDLFLKDWLKIFPRENFLFMKYEDYSKGPVEYIDKHVLPFLGVPPFTNAEKLKLSKLKVYSSHSKMTVLPKTKQILDEFYQQSKESLARLLNDEKFLWKDSLEYNPYL